MQAAPAPFPARGAGLAIPLVAMAVAALLLFARLGHYPLWDDEAYTALNAKGIMRTGDTSAIIDHNIVAYNEGFMLHGTFDRWSAPLAPYLLAPFLGRDGTSSLAARLPFAICGFAAICLILAWTRQASRLTQALVALGLLGNVSLLLYLRQCRYYAPNVLLCVAIVGIYLHRRRWRMAGIATLLVLLFAANPLTCAAFSLALGADYLGWGRRERPFAYREWLGLGVTLAACCLPLAMIWNPFRTHYLETRIHHTLTDYGRLWISYVRDINRCEFVPGLLLAASLLAGFVQRDPWIRRGSLALGIYVTFVAMFSPQRVDYLSFADVRHLVVVIPLCVLLSVRGLLLLSRGRAFIALPLAAVAFGTNLLNGGPILRSGFRSTIAAYVGELRQPPPDPYTAAIRWITDMVKPAQSLWVMPSYMTYPLMFHAPWPVYAWQLAASNHDSAFAGLPPIHFQQRVPPDYILVFGPGVASIEKDVAKWGRLGVTYERVARLDAFWRDEYRPEIFWRTFQTIPIDRSGNNVIYAMRRLTPPLTARP